MKRLLHIALIAVAALLLAGCPDYIPPETTPEETIVVTPEGVQIPFEVTASTSADDDTKITVDYGGTHLFQAGDILRISGEHISGDLTMQGDAGYDYATFKGTLTWTGEGMPAADLPLTATLISEFNRMPTEGDPYANAIADYLDQAVQQFSNISGTGTYGGKTFALRQSSAFIQFEIDMAGLSENGKVKVRIQNKSVTEILASCDTVTIKGGKARFTVAFAPGTVLEHASVYIDGLVVRFAGAGVTLVGNKSYKVTKTVDPLETPLSFYWINGYLPDRTIYLNNYLSAGTLQYSLNGGPKTPLGSDMALTFHNKDVIQLFDDNAGEHGNFGGGPVGISLQVYGNVMSLVNSETYPTLKELTGEKVFRALFYHNHNFSTTNHSTRDILLPATTLSPYCYAGMFQDSGMTRLPENMLPADNLAPHCYGAMFYYCPIRSIPEGFLPAREMKESCYERMFFMTNITSIPEKLFSNVTTLSKNCFNEMFLCCQKLVSIPEGLLPFENLSEGCYRGMFQGCTILTSIPYNLLPAKTPAKSCYSRMFYQCFDLESIPSGLLQATTLAPNCFSEMFYQCLALTEIPEGLLKIKTLQEACYAGMFFGCSNLTAISEKLFPEGMTLARNCFSSMFNSCGLTAIPEKLLPNTTLADGCYRSMFSNCRQLESIPEKLLPAMSLEKNCYISMFANCTSLTSIPDNLLKAITLNNYCYQGMFQGCSGLTSLPENLLSASVSSTTGLFEECYAAMFANCTGLSGIPNGFLPDSRLAKGCYRSMFSGCSGLTSLPTGLLSASTVSTTGLFESCYDGMFQNCTGLTSIPTGFLPEQRLALKCYAYMFYGCSSIAGVPSNLLPAETLAYQCYRAMFAQCTSLTAAPDLNAEKLRNLCYAGMFSGCSSLGSVRCTAKILYFDPGCLENWLKDVPSSGTFTKSPDIAVGEGGWTIGASGIPDGWTVQDAI